ncbi:hypothetical protein PanWU01x14_350250, partial [Parasponia andersonii]
AFHSAFKRREKYKICIGKGFPTHFCIETCCRQKHLYDVIREHVRKDSLCQRNMVVN